VCLQHEGIPTHFTGHWIVCGSTLHVPFSWLSCSSDLTTTDNILWGIIKGYMITTMLICAVMMNRWLQTLHHRCFGKCYTEHGSISGWVRNRTICTQICLVNNNSQHMVSRITLTSLPSCILPVKRSVNADRMIQNVKS
jgi:hypothetical protein